LTIGNGNTTLNSRVSSSSTSHTCLGVLLNHVGEPHHTPDTRQRHEPPAAVFLAHSLPRNCSAFPPYANKHSYIGIIIVICVGIEIEIGIGVEIGFGVEIGIEMDIEVEVD